ncbi:MAG: hypothetical protein ACXIVE_16800 [Salinarimonas sp.]
MRRLGPNSPGKSGPQTGNSQGDNRFGVPDQRSRHGFAARFALVVLLSMATIGIIAIANTTNMTDADASGHDMRSTAPIETSKTPR